LFERVAASILDISGLNLLSAAPLLNRALAQSTLQDWNYKRKWLNCAQKDGAFHNRKAARDQRWNRLEYNNEERIEIIFTCKVS
jgi:hypothetical protein